MEQDADSALTRLDLLQVCCGLRLWRVPVAIAGQTIQGEWV